MRNIAAIFETLGEIKRQGAATLRCDPLLAGGRQ
jgi:hypothetical protein